MHMYIYTLTTCIAHFCTFRRKGGDAVRMIPDNDGGTNGVILFAPTTKPSLTPTPYLEFVPHKGTDGEITAHVLVCMSHMQQNLMFLLKGIFIDVYLTSHVDTVCMC